MSELAVIRLLLMAIDSHELDGDEKKLKAAANKARLMLRGDDD
jgi:hypothetical protein